MSYNPYIGAYPSDIYYTDYDTSKFETIDKSLQDCQPLCNKQIPDMDRDKKCCWSCISCNEGQYINETLLMCLNCSQNEIPSSNLTLCVPEPTPPVIYNPTPEMYILLGFSTLGIFTSIILVVYIYLKRDTPMVMASTPDLCYIQAVTQSLLFISSVFMLPT